MCRNRRELRLDVTLLAKGIDAVTICTVGQILARIDTMDGKEIRRMNLKRRCYLFDVAAGTILLGMTARTFLRLNACNLTVARDPIHCVI